MNPLVSIVVLNWNGWQDTLECLESIYRINYPNYRVILVDNHSKDQSLKKIREYSQGKITVQSKFFTYNPKNKPINVRELTNRETEKPSPEKDNLDSGGTNRPSTLTLIKNDVNYGFALGNNIAIKYTLKKHRPDYIFLLNNDTVVDPDFLDKLIQTAEEDPQIGVVGPLIYYYDANGKTDVVANLGGMINLKEYPGYYDLTETSNLEDYTGKQIIECEWVSGAALLLKSRDNPIKVLNDKLFFGCEDIDLALNLKEYGYKSVVVLDSHIWHKEAVSRRKRSEGGAKRAMMEIKSNLTFLKAHNDHYYLYLPHYLIQIFVLYVKVIANRR